MTKHRILRQMAAASAIAAVAVGLVGCGSSDSGSDGAEQKTTTTAAAEQVALSEEQATAAATTHADLVWASYTDTVDAATQLQTDIAAFVADPTDATLETAKQSWLTARDAYGPTEVFRFSDGPIDNPDDGPEGQINAWPMDEAYVDYVEDDPEAGIINDAEGVPEITREVIVSANEEGGETNISTGWHAIEFLLWGQDLSESGPGERPVTDYTTSPTAERRGQYLTQVTDLLVEDLTGVADQWNPEGGAYRTEFLEDPDQAVSDILRGMGALSAGELAGERIAVALDTKEQEDEHSCFSDNTLADVINNARGIQLAYTAEYEGVDGPSLSDVVADVDPELDADLLEQLEANVARAEGLEKFGTFEEIIRSDEDSEGHVEMSGLVDDLQAQGDAIAAVGAALGYEVSLEI
ncbi:imelysin family protein [Aquihabitans daechungensis]|uniref:imelysin family protein n=1 Tax=Aquihabitans daechungensis TaxID=1052257 RepID=UPI003B9E980C